VKPKPVEQACDADLRLSPQALLRAAQRARELAARTGTAMVVGHDGVVEHIEPQPQPAGPRVQERPAGYGDKA
jgi:hypothetical protein